MKALLASATIAAVLAPAAVHAEIFGVIKTAQENIVLADVRGACPVDFNMAFRMISRNGEPRGQGGCYRITPKNEIQVYIVADNNPSGRIYSFDDFVLSDYYRRMNPLAR